MMLAHQSFQSAPNALKHTPVLENSFREREGGSLVHILILWHVTPGVGQEDVGEALTGYATSS